MRLASADTISAVTPNIVPMTIPFQRTNNAKPPCITATITPTIQSAGCSSPNSIREKRYRVPRGQVVLQKHVRLSEVHRYVSLWYPVPAFPVAPPQIALGPRKKETISEIIAITDKIIHIGKPASGKMVSALFRSALVSSPISDVSGFPIPYFPKGETLWEGQNFTCPIDRV